MVPLICSPWERTPSGIIPTKLLTLVVSRSWGELQNKFAWFPQFGWESDDRGEHLWPFDHFCFRLFLVHDIYAGHYAPYNTYHFSSVLLDITCSTRPLIFPFARISTRQKVCFFGFQHKTCYVSTKLCYFILHRSLCFNKTFIFFNVAKFFSRCDNFIKIQGIIYKFVCVYFHYLF